MNDIARKRNTFNFFGNESSQFFKHLTFITDHIIVSNCSSSSCPSASETTRKEVVPVINSQNSNSFQQEVQNWFFGQWEAPCKPIQDEIGVPDEHVFWDFNHQL